MKLQFGQTQVVTAAESPEEIPYLCRIAEDLSSSEPKLTYADWLESKGDSRGKFLREFVQATRKPGAVLPVGDQFSLPWRSLVGVVLIRAVRNAIADGRISGSHIQEVEQVFMQRARPALYIFCHKVDESLIGLGESKHGGFPDLPGGVPWPIVDQPVCYGEGKKCIARFCGQVRLSDLGMTVAGQLLPSSGLLSLMKSYDRKAIVRLDPEGTSFERLTPPEAPRFSFDYPYTVSAMKMQIIDGMDIPTSAVDLTMWPESFYFENFESFDEVRLELFCRDRFSNPIEGFAQLLGYGREPNGYQPDPERGFRRLAEFWNRSWGDSGNPFFFIRDADLRKGRFDDVECGDG